MAVINGDDQKNNLIGGGEADSIFGFGADDVLAGNDGNDLLNGGTGNDELFGGNGNDTYIVDSQGDTVEEVGGQSNGLDTIITSVNFNMFLNADNVGDVENLLGSGANALFLVGNSLNNLVVGGTGNDTIDGGIGGGIFGDIVGTGVGNDTLDGGVGADTMAGGVGDDVFRIDNIGDKVVEKAGEGFDTIESTIDISLVGFANVEKLVLIGNGNVDVIGDNDANVLTGNDGVNTLNGLGGNDTLIGGKGNDFYIVDTVNDKVVEASNGGTDRVRTIGTSFSIEKLTNVEQLTAASSSETGNFNFTGNLRDNVMSGNAGKNVLSGAAGRDTIAGQAGNDTLKGGTGINTLTGGTGADTFVFDTAANAKNLNVIRDYEKADKITIDNGVSFFKAIGANGTLKADAFTLGTKAADAEDRLIYDQASGNLFFDADGTGGAGQVRIAKFVNKFALTAGEFQIV